MIELFHKTPSNVQYNPVVLDVLPVDVSALLGLDLLHSYSLYANKVSAELVHAL